MHERALSADLWPYAGDQLLPPAPIMHKRAPALLDSDAPLVVIEAPAGCGKTYQGAKYAARAASTLETGRVLILTHTHAACAAFAAETRAASRKVEIRTIDSLIVQIATAYNKSLQQPVPSFRSRSAIGNLCQPAN